MSGMIRALSQYHQKVDKCGRQDEMVQARIESGGYSVLGGVGYRVMPVAIGSLFCSIIISLLTPFYVVREKTRRFRRELSQAKYSVLGRVGYKVMPVALGRLFCSNITVSQTPFYPPPGHCQLNVSIMELSMKEVQMYNNDKMKSWP